MIARHRGAYPLPLMCRVLAVSRAGFHAWTTRGRPPRAPEDVALTMRMVAPHRRARNAYGARRHQCELAATGAHHSRRRIQRLMHAAGCVAVQTKRWRPTGRAAESATRAANVLNRAFTVAAPNRVWAADLTYGWTQEGGLFVAVVLDLCSRRVGGWATSTTPDQHVALVAWRRAVAVRQPPPGLIHHSDRGSTYVSGAYQAALAAVQAVPSLSRAGNCWDNAVVESCFATLKQGLVPRQGWATRSSLTRALVDYIDGWYNPERRHSHLGYVSPIAFEAQLPTAA